MGEFAKATHKKLTSKFLGQDGQVMSQKDLKYLKEGGKGQNYYKEIKDKLMIVLKVVAAFGILRAFLGILGLE